MQYKFKNEYVTRVLPVDAQTVGETLEQIREKHWGRLLPSDVVEESRPEDAPLHVMFEWDDYAAAEKYRLSQAAQLIRCVVIEYAPEDSKDARQVRAFHCVSDENGRSYQPLSECLTNADFRQQMLSEAKKDLTEFKDKYRDLEFASRHWRNLFETTDNILVEA